MDKGLGVEGSLVRFQERAAEQLPGEFALGNVGKEWSFWVA